MTQSHQHAGRPGRHRKRLFGAVVDLQRVTGRFRLVGPLRAPAAWTEAEHARSATLSRSAPRSDLPDQTPWSGRLA